MKTRTRVKTRQEVRREFYEAGISIKSWAEENGFSPWLVYSVLKDNRPLSRGASHAIAVKLGLKLGRSGVGVTA